MKWKIIIFISLLLAALSSSVYIVAIDSEYAPYEFVDASGRANSQSALTVTGYARKQAAGRAKSLEMEAQECKQTEEE